MNSCTRIVSNRCHSLLASLAIAIFVSASIPHAKATVSALGTLAESATGASFNTYILTLQNTSTAGNTLETFWFAWVPGQNYLDTTPLSVQTPTGWTDTITHGGSSDGYAIRFSTSTNPLAVGSILSGFGFTSADSLAQISGTSNFYPVLATTSEVSTGPNDGGSSSSAFVVTVVPEPGSFALVSVAGAGLLCWRKRRRSL
jgi:hypothetical protein